jgi:hypothetical protein
MLLPAFKITLSVLLAFAVVYVTALVLVALVATHDVHTEYGTVPPPTVPPPTLTGRR